MANALARTAERAGAGLVIVDLDLDTLLAGAEAIVARFRAALQGAPCGRVRLAVVDHIGSNPPFEFPLPALIAACRDAGAKGALPEFTDQHLHTPVPKFRHLAATKSALSR